MLQQFLSQLNFVALLASAIAMLIIGSIWYSFLFGKIWQAALEKLGMSIDRPSGGEATGMFIGAFIYNVIISFAIGYLVYSTQTTTWVSAVKLGALTGCILWAGIAGNYIWERRSMKSLFIDGSYHVLSCVVASVLLTMWK